jgi:hypothetical protein
VKQQLLFSPLVNSATPRAWRTRFLSKSNLIRSILFVYWPGLFFPPVLVSRRPPHYLSFFTIVNSMISFKYCPQHAAHGLVPFSANPAFITLYGSETFSRCTSGCLRRPSFQSAASAASAASSTSLPFPILHHSSASAHTPWALAFELRLEPRERSPNSAYRRFHSFPRSVVYLLYSRTATGLLSNSAFSVVPIANVHACRHSLPPA